MSVGFAVLSTTLNINGTARVKSQTWDIHFENVNITEGSVEAIKEAIIANEAATLVEYEIELSKPGDFYEFTVDAVNKGSLDAILNSVLLTGVEDNEQYVSYSVTYLDGTEILVGDDLKSNTEKTYKVRVEYKKDIVTLPTDDLNLTLVFGVTYNQNTEKEDYEAVATEFSYAATVTGGGSCQGTYKWDGSWGSQGAWVCDTAGCASSIGASDVLGQGWGSGDKTGQSCTNSKYTYACPDGGTLSGSTCSGIEYTCPNGGTLTIVDSVNMCVY